jgi:Uma2 family endonuclease
MSISTNEPTSICGEPAWDIAQLFPAQGHWSEQEYFHLANSTNRLIEFSDGRIEVLTMPTMTHQLILQFLFGSLDAFTRAGRLGTVMLAGIRVRLSQGKYREPDVLFMLAEHASRMGEQFWDGADLVMEVVSEDRRRDLETKRIECTEAGIPEYWIVDPREARITVLSLEGSSYVVLGEYGKGERAVSRLLSGFSMDVLAALEAKP